MNKALYYLLLVGVFLCCEPSIVSPRKYIQLVEERLVIAQNDQRLRYELQYQPSEYRALHTLDQEQMNEMYFTKELRHLEGHQYFRFRVMTLDGLPIKELLGAEEVINSLRFRIQKDFVLRYGAESYPCVLYHLQDSGISTDQLEFMCVFKMPIEAANPLHSDLVFRCKNENISTTPIDFVIEKQLVNQLPSIRL
ncbi:MAG: hypothetical protein AAFO82_03710 [Bacteroidota bacterium]